MKVQHDSPCRNCSGQKIMQARNERLTKIIMLLLLLVMAAHIVKPLGLPGLKRRRDFWKIGLFAFAAVMVTILLREAASLS